MNLFAGPMILALFVLTGCSSVSRIAIRSQSGMFTEASNTLNREYDWEWFKATAPANIKMMETLALTDKKNLGLRRLLVKAYAGYAYAVWETELLAEQLADEQGPSAALAEDFYGRAIDYALEVLAAKDVTKQDLISLEEKQFIKKLDDELNKDDYAMVLFAAQAWGSLINLKKHDIALVAQAPRIKLIFDWVCSKDPNIELGICHLFNAQYAGARPKMLGGDPARGKELFLSFIKEHPYHLLAQISYLQYAVIPAMDDVEFDQVSKTLQAEFNEFNKLSQRGAELESTSRYNRVPEYHLFNATAKKRFEILQKYRQELF